MSGAFAYYLAPVRWLNATDKPLEEAVRELLNVLNDRLVVSDGNLSFDYIEPERQSDDTHFAVPCTPSSPSIPMRDCAAPQATSGRRAGLFDGIRDLVSGAFDRLGERNQPENTDPTPKRGESRMTAAPSISRVQFAAISPRKAPPSSYSTVDIVMYEDGWEDAVDSVAKEHGESTKTTTSGWIRAREGTMVIVQLSSPELGNIGERAGAWHGRYLRFGFLFKIPESLSESEVLLDAEVLFDGVPATHLSFVVEVGRSEGKALTIERRDITSAFMSYSSKDRGRVAVLMQGIETVRPDLDVFLDVEKLRCGDEWERVLSDEIKKRDVLFLCWSRAASESRWVDYEWRCAYESKGLKGIEPVAIEPPDRCPPPQELASKHFNSRLLYIANST